MGACPSVKFKPPPLPPTPSPPCKFMVTPACRPIQQRERQLVDSGPTWRAPSVAGVLRNLPFMRHAPPQVLEVCPCTLGPLPSPSSPPPLLHPPPSSGSYMSCSVHTEYDLTTVSTGCNQIELTGLIPLCDSSPAGKQQCTDGVGQS